MFEQNKKHPYFQSEIAFATMHKKEQILANLFQETLAARLIVPPGLNTDQYGTFSGEIHRTQGVKSVLRSKAYEGARLTGLNWALASEGSFGPHPWIPFVECNQEALLFLDVKNQVEIFSHVISTENRTHYQEVQSEQEVMAFCERVGCGEQGVIIKPRHETSDHEWIQKGLTNTQDVLAAYRSLTSRLAKKTAWLETDNRAHMSPKRQNVIYQAGKKLLGVILSQCPACQTPGFQMSDHVRGLVCQDCGRKSDKPAQEIWTCPNAGCDFQDLRGRQDGLQFLDPSECDYCNP